jgi:hypothetical protein
MENLPIIREPESCEPERLELLDMDWFCEDCSALRNCDRSNCAQLDSFIRTINGG